MGNADSSSSSTNGPAKELEDWIIPYSHFEWKRVNNISIPGDVIARGTQGTVYKTLYGDYTVALKEFHSTIIRGISTADLSQTKDAKFAIPEHALKEFYNEARTLQELRHPCCLGLYGISLSPSVLLVMEYCPTSLHKVLYSDMVIEGFVLMRWIRQIAAGMAYLHSKSLVHRDLKPENILLSSERIEEAHAKICDFGIAQALDSLSSPGNTLTASSSSSSSASCISVVGSPPFQPPEALGRLSLDALLDSFAQIPSSNNGANPPPQPPPQPPPPQPPPQQPAPPLCPLCAENKTTIMPRRSPPPQPASASTSVPTCIHGVPLPIPYPNPSHHHHHSNSSPPNSPSRMESLTDFLSSYPSTSNLGDDNNNNNNSHSKNGSLSVSGGMRSLDVSASQSQFNQTQSQLSDSPTSGSVASRPDRKKMIQRDSGGSGGLAGIGGVVGGGGKHRRKSKHHRRSVHQQALRAADVYAFGVLAWCIVARAKPFAAFIATPEKLKEYVVKGGRPVVPDWVPSWLSAVIISCWAQNPAARPDFDAINAQLANLRVKDNELNPPKPGPEPPKQTNIPSSSSSASSHQSHNPEIKPEPVTSKQPPLRQLPAGAQGQAQAQGQGPGQDGSAVAPPKAPPPRPGSIVGIAQAIGQAVGQAGGGGQQSSSALVQPHVSVVIPSLPSTSSLSSSSSLAAAADQTRPPIRIPPTPPPSSSNVKENLDHNNKSPTTTTTPSGNHPKNHHLFSRNNSSDDVKGKTISSPVNPRSPPNRLPSSNPRSPPNRNPGTNPRSPPNRHHQHSNSAQPPTTGTPVIASHHHSNSAQPLTGTPILPARAPPTHPPNSSDKGVRVAPKPPPFLASISESTITSNIVLQRKDSIESKKSTDLLDDGFEDGRRESGSMPGSTGSSASHSRQNSLNINSQVNLYSSSQPFLTANLMRPPLRSGSPNQSIQSPYIDDLASKDREREYERRLIASNGSGSGDHHRRGEHKEEGTARRSRSMDSRPTYAQDWFPRRANDVGPRVLVKQDSSVLQDLIQGAKPSTSDDPEKRSRRSSLTEGSRRRSVIRLVPVRNRDGDNDLNHNNFPELVKTPPRRPPPSRPMS